jgi:hypothetical protein
MACATMLALVAATAVSAAELVHRYDFEEEDGTDSVGEAHGIVQGFPDFTDDAVSGNRSMTLLGEDWIEVDEPMDFGMQFSIAAWVLPDPTAMNIQTIIGNSPGGYEQDGFKFFYNVWTSDSSTADGSLRFETGDGFEGVGTATEPGLLFEEVWTHVAVAADVDAAATAIYVDGDLFAEGSLNSFMTTESPFTIGRMMTGWNMHGSLDDVQIYEGLFTAEDVEFLYSNPGSALGEAPTTALEAGDANMDYQFNQLDLVQVQVAAKYLTGDAATWGEGDWNGAPGGSPGNPPQGDGVFSQNDIIAALSAGKYLTGPYNAVAGGGVAGDGQTSVGYHAGTGEVWVDAPAGVALTSINIDSTAGIFTGEPAENLGGSFDNDADVNIFKATFGDSFGSISFGNVAQTGLAQDVVLADLTVVGSLAGGGDLGDVDLIYVPEPSALLLLSVALVASLLVRRRR